VAKTRIGVDVGSTAVRVAEVLYTTLLGGDGGEDLAAPRGPTGGTTAPTTAPSVSESPTPRETLPPVDLMGRDPFSIPPGLQTQSASGSVGPTGSTGSTSTTTPPTTTTTPPTTTTTIPPPTSPPPGGGGGGGGGQEETNHVTIGGHDVMLESVAGNGKKLQVEVDGKLYTVEEGALFDENFKLVKIDGDCARFLFGDQSFTLCEDP